MNDFLSIDYLREEHDSDHECFHLFTLVPAEWDLPKFSFTEAGHNSLVPSNETNIVIYMHGKQLLWAI